MNAHVKELHEILKEQFTESDTMDLILKSPDYDYLQRENCSEGYTTFKYQHTSKSLIIPNYSFALSCFS